ncbi:MAG: hypothetical protein V4710_17870 [Verrucomicrobiota bacterium]
MNHHPFQPARIIQAVFRCRSFLAAFAVFGLALSALGQVNYVRELTGTEGFTSLLQMTQAPYETSRPDYSTMPSKPYLVTRSHYYTIDPSNGGVLPLAGVQFPPTVKLGIGSLVALSGQNTASPLLHLVTSQNTILTFKITTGQPITQTPLLDATVYSSMAARSRDAQLLSLIADNQHFTANPITGELISVPLADVKMSEAFYQSYGQDGLLYVLDYANDRIASFDPDNAFAPVGGFSLSTSVTTANVQFAIGPTGSFYLADGLGGGSYYDSTGAFHGAFSLPGGTVGDPYTGASYVSTDSVGSVYIFDSATGFHQFQDVAVSAVPEPGATLTGMALICLAAASRRRRQSLE